MAGEMVNELPLIGTVPDGWLVAQFGDILTDGTRNGIYKAKQHHGRGTKIVNMGELFAYPRLRTVEMRRVELSNEEIGRFGLSPGDLLFARRSLIAKGAGKCSIVLETDEPTSFESSIIRARPDPTRSDSLFLFYLFNSPYGSYSLGSILRQVAVSGITGSDLVKLVIPLPPLPEQRAIAHILGTLDDKIELNWRINETLEAMARAIFKSWFVDFDPVRAKAEGKDTGLPPHIADLFPDRFEGSELGEIPAGWNVAQVSDLATIIGGSTPSTKVPAYWDNGIHAWATPKDLSGLSAPVLLSTERLITQEGLGQISSGLLPAGTLLLSSRAPIGYLAITEIPVAINQGFIAMQPRNQVSNLYLLYWASSAQDEILSRANGSTFLEVNKANFRQIPIVQASRIISEAFEHIVRPLYQRVVNNERESRVLASTRDALLPKLLSGEIWVKDAERIVGTAA